VLVNNGVSAEDKPIEDVDDADLDRVIRSGIYGSLYPMQATLFARRYRHLRRSETDNSNMHFASVVKCARREPLHQASRYIKVTEVSYSFPSRIAGRMPM